MAMHREGTVGISICVSWNEGGGGTPPHIPTQQLRLSSGLRAKIFAAARQPFGLCWNEGGLPPLIPTDTDAETYGSVHNKMDRS